jgi:hypothetical protein
MQRILTGGPSVLSSFLRCVVIGADANVTAAQAYFFSQRIEGHMLSDFSYGTSVARIAILSFWIRCNNLGVLSICCRNIGATRTFIGTITINAINTWEFKTIVIPGDTVATLLQETNFAFDLSFILGVGTNFQSDVSGWHNGNFFASSTHTRFISIAACTLDITGVQLEPGEVATDFAYVPFELEYIRCQRYFEKSFNSAVAPAQSAGSQGASIAVQAVGAAANFATIGIPFKVEKRVTPSIVTYNPSAANSQMRNITLPADCSATIVGNIGTSGFSASATSAAGSAAGNSNAIHWTAAAEVV